jgi:hypothetical protein
MEKVKWEWSATRIGIHHNRFHPPVAHYRGDWMWAWSKTLSVMTAAETAIDRHLGRIVREQIDADTTDNGMRPW